MEVNDVDTCTGQVAEGPEEAEQPAVSPLTRQEAVKYLLEEIEQNEKLAGKFQKLIESRIFSLAVPAKMFKSSDESFEGYLYMRDRLKILRSLFKFMKCTARQL